MNMHISSNIYDDERKFALLMTKSILGIVKYSIHRNRGVVAVRNSF